LNTVYPNIRKLVRLGLHSELGFNLSVEADLAIALGSVLNGSLAGALGSSE
jgi:hypothetical protein